MYKNSYDQEFHNETNFAKGWIVWLFGLILVVSFIVWFGNTSEKVVQSGIVNYEQFQEIYNTCSKLNTDLGTIRAVPESDRMFESFSKEAVIANKRQQMSRWVEEYNAKSNMWTKSI